MVRHPSLAGYYEVRCVEVVQAVSYRLSSFRPSRWSTISRRALLAGTLFANRATWPTATNADGWGCHQLWSGLSCAESPYW